MQPEALWLARIVVLAAVAGLGGAPAAQAGAWLRNEGQGTLIVALTASRGAGAFGDDGWTSGVGDFSKLGVSSYAEYGVTEGITALFRQDVQWAAFESPSGARQSARRVGPFSAGARVAMWRTAEAALSAEALVTLAGDIDASDRNLLAPHATEWEARILFGWGGDVFAHHSFFDSQLGFRARSGAPADEIDLDATVGREVSGETLLLFQSFNTFSATPAEPPFVTYRRHKVQLSSVHVLDSHVRLQLGAVFTFAGDRTAREAGALVALWWNF